MELINFLIEHYFLSVPLVILITLFLISNSKKGGKKISSQTLISLSNQDKAYLIDLRESEAFQSGHITNSINIPFNNLVNRTNEINQKDKSIILICDMGSVSPNAGETLKKEGFTNVLILKGGINEWKMQNLPLV
mgnify:FL=1